MTGQHTPTPAQDSISIPRQRGAERGAAEETGAWNGWVRFGGVVMVVVGAFAVLEGILALAAPTTFYAVEGTVLAIDLTGWGWLHLILGVLVLATGASLLGREVPGWARGVGRGPRRDQHAGAARVAVGVPDLVDRPARARRPRALRPDRHRPRVTAVSRLGRDAELIHTNLSADQEQALKEVFA